MSDRTPEEARAAIRLAGECTEQAIIDVAEELGGIAVVNAVRAAGLTSVPGDFRWSNNGAMEVMNFLYPGIGEYVMERTEDLIADHHAQAN